MAESPVQFHERREEEFQGQAQVPGPELHDGKHVVHEAITITDRVITDASSDEAVQVPEGVGASTAGHESPMAVAYRRGTPESQFDAEREDSDDSDKDKQVSPEAKADDKE